MEEPSFKEARIRKLTQLYYSNKKILNAIFAFCKNREAVPSYMMQGFGKRPDAFEYPGDIFELVKKGATSFHCSEERWSDPLRIATGMNEKELNVLREGWDLVIDIDCPWLDYSKLAAKAILESLRNCGVKNVGVKYSGSKGFHLLVPWEAFPKTINEQQTATLFPELPRKILAYLRFASEKILKENLPDNFYEHFKNVKIKRGVKCKTCNELAREYLALELFCPSCKITESRKINAKEKKETYFCAHCRKPFVITSEREGSECLHCTTTSLKNPELFSQTAEVDLYELMGLDLVLVSPRHLFRAPYSLHEKTALASVVIVPKELDSFDVKQADPMNLVVRNFLPSAQVDEAKELVVTALDWAKDNTPSETFVAKKTDFAPIKLDKLSDDFLPPSIQQILKGVSDGRKRALFVLLNLFRSLGIERDELEQRIEEWNEKNAVPLKKGYIKSQLSWSYRNKIVPPPNFDKDYYKGIGVVPTPEELRAKNPVTWVQRKAFGSAKKTKKVKKKK